MHYVENRLETLITKAENKPNITLKERDFLAAFEHFMQTYYIDYTSLYQGNIKKIDNEKVTFETKFGIGYGDFNEHRTIHMIAENKESYNWKFTFVKVTKGLDGSLEKIKSDENEENEELNWEAFSKEGKVFCRKCEKKLGKGDKYSLDFKPKKGTIIEDISCTQVFEGDRQMELFVRLRCGRCYEENAFISKSYIE